jgi:hypothetical protein
MMRRGAGTGRDLGEIGEEEDCARNKKWRGLATIERRVK